MSKSTAVSRRIAACIKSTQRGDYETALIHLFPALDVTAKRRRPNDGVGKRVRGFFADEEDLISALAVGGILQNVCADGIGFPEAMYRFARTAIVHEGQLDARLQISDSSSLSIGEVWSLPSSYVSAICIAVMAARENVGEQIAGSGTLVLFERRWKLGELWGAEAKLRSAMATIFPKPFQPPVA